MLLVPVVSSDIAAMGYDPNSAELQIQFRNGRVYSYQNVPPDLYAGLISAPSKGSFFAQAIKKFPGSYPYTRIDGGINLPVSTQTEEALGEASAGPSVLQTIEEFEGLL